MEREYENDHDPDADDYDKLFPDDWRSNWRLWRYFFGSTTIEEEK